MLCNASSGRRSFCKAIPRLMSVGAATPAESARSADARASSTRPISSRMAQRLPRAPAWPGCSESTWSKLASAGSSCRAPAGRPPFRAINASGAICTALSKLAIASSKRPRSCNRYPRWFHVPASFGASVRARSKLGEPHLAIVSVSALQRLKSPRGSELEAQHGLPFGSASAWRPSWFSTALTLLSTAGAFGRIESARS